jgi:hypothetical protein
MDMGARKTYTVAARQAHLLIVSEMMRKGKRTTDIARATSRTLSAISKYATDMG